MTLSFISVHSLTTAGRENLGRKVLTAVRAEHLPASKEEHPLFTQDRGKCLLLMPGREDVQNYLCYKNF